MVDPAAADVYSLGGSDTCDTSEEEDAGCAGGAGGGA